MCAYDICQQNYDAHFPPLSHFRSSHPSILSLNDKIGFFPFSHRLLYLSPLSYQGEEERLLGAHDKHGVEAFEICDFLVMIFELILWNFQRFWSFPILPPPLLRRSLTTACPFQGQCTDSIAGAQEDRHSFPETV